MSRWGKLIDYFVGWKSAPEEPSAECAAFDPAAPPIGVAWMERDRTVYVRMRLETPDGTVGDVNLRYPKRHPRYRDIVAYLALGPGQARRITRFDLPR